jgi:hypothetical protein
MRVWRQRCTSRIRCLNIYRWCSPGRKRAHKLGRKSLGDRALHLGDELESGTATPCRKPQQESENPEGWSPARRGFHIGDHVQETFDFSLHGGFTAVLVDGALANAGRLVDSSRGCARPGVDGTDRTEQPFNLRDQFPETFRGSESFLQEEGFTATLMPWRTSGIESRR